jgi:hypothetical protein
MSTTYVSWLSVPVNRHFQVGRPCVNTSGRGRYQFDLHEGFVAVVEEVAGFSRVDTYDSKEKLAAESQGKRSFILFYDGLG